MISALTTEYTESTERTPGKRLCGLFVTFHVCFVLISSYLDEEEHDDTTFPQVGLPDLCIADVERTKKSRLRHKQAGSVCKVTL
jgi:hypothetical protein